MPDPRTAIVQAGYDAMAERHVSWAPTIEGDPRARMLNALLTRLPDGSGALALLARCATWLTPGGWLLASLGPGAPTTRPNGGSG